MTVSSISPVAGRSPTSTVSSGSGTGWSLAVMRPFDLHLVVVTLLTEVPSRHDGTWLASGSINIDAVVPSPYLFRSCTTSCKPS